MMTYKQSFMVAWIGLGLVACGSPDDPLGGEARRPSLESSQGAEVNLRAGYRKVELQKMPGWTLVSEHSSHALEFSKEGVRATIFMEHRNSDRGALRRLKEIDQEQLDPASTFSLKGHQALKRVRTFLPPLPSGIRAPIAQEVTQVTVAVAIGDVVLRAEASVEPTLRELVASDLEDLLATAEVSLNDPGSEPLAVKRAGSRHVDVAPSVADNLGATASGNDNEEVTFRDDELPPVALAMLPGFNQRINAGFGVDSEIEVAVSDNGRDIVVVNNSRDFTTSNTFGESFSPTQILTGGPPANGDPSIAWAQSGSFYFAYIAFPNGSAASGGVTGCSTGIHSSTDNGQNFAFTSHAFLSPPTGVNVTFPDQEHIAADRVNASTSGDDQVYSVWRDFPPAAPSAASTCAGGPFGGPTPSIVCSADGAANWSARVPVGTGDFPRVTVGPDGSVYVAFMNNGAAGGPALMLNKFSSCDTGLVQQAGFPVVVATGVNFVNCGAGGIPGLDRCNSGTDGRSPTVAVAEDDPSHVFVAYASNSAANNENVFLQDSIDGGMTWTRPALQLNAGVTGHRFMPWVCATGDTAHVSWYDQRAGVTGASNDLTQFFASTAQLDGGGALVANPEFAISQAQDPLCASGWPAAPRAPANAENCSVQPQLAGVCSVSGARCDFSDCAGGLPTCTCTVAGETCNTGGGIPKYGDYNGSACAAGRFYTAWASATAPAGQPQPTSIDVFFACPPDVDDVNGTFADTTPPIFTSVPPDLSLNGCTVGDLGTPEAFDPCGNAPVTITNDAPSQFPPGTTTVTWTATDAAGNTSTATQTVTATLGNDPSCCPAGTNVLVGTSNNDVITGTSGSDCIIALGAQDVINGLGGDDFISAGDGDDVINAGSGNDFVDAGSGQDQVFGGEGDDTLFGGDGDDFVAAGAGNDTVSGGQGQDQLQGEQDNDTLFGDDGDDVLLGGDNDDQLDGGGLHDTCDGGSGVNTFTRCEGAPDACEDGVQNALETDVDCGGPACGGCAAGEQCQSGGDCAELLCVDGLCVASTTTGSSSLAASLDLTTDWGAGYCATLSVTNNGTDPTTTWTVTIDTNASTIFTDWNGVFSGASGEVTIMPGFSFNEVIAPGDTNTTIGFCANRDVGGSGTLPVVLSAVPE